MSAPYIIGLTVAGWLATTWLAYRWGLHSQKLQREDAAKSAMQSRRREFLAFITSWRREVERICARGDASWELPKFFDDSIASFCGSAEIIRRDFTKDKRKRFEELVGAVSNFQTRRKNREEYEPFIKVIDDIIACVNAAC